MSWSQPTGNLGPNAPSYTPGGAAQNTFNPAAGGYYPQQQQQQPMQQGGMYYPPQQQQGGMYYPPQQQQGGMYYPPQQQGGMYYPSQQQQQGGYRGGYQSGMHNMQQQGGYQDPTNYNNQGGYNPRGGYGGRQQQQLPQQEQQQQQRYQQNESYQQQQQQPQPPQQPQQPQQQQQQQQQQQRKPAVAVPAPKTSASDAAKLSLGGGAAAPVAVPKKKGGGTLSLGKKKQQDVAKAPEEAASESPAPAPSPSAAPKPASAAESSAAEQGAAATPAPADTTSKPASPAPAAKEAAATPAPAAKEATATTEKDRAKQTSEDLRESVRKEIARQRQQSKKQYTRDPRQHFNIVFCGHVDAGKSTISGHLLMEKGLVDQREMDKLRREAEINHREGWEYAYVMDVSEEERSKGITRETGAAYFETEKRRVTVLDAPGHKAFVPSMIGGATQADICVLVISSRTGEFETGFEKGGQTREHAMLVRTCGVKQMICVINKMDEMKWSKERYDEIVGKLKPFLRQNGYDEERAKNLIFMPVAGLTGENLIKRVDPSHCDWYEGETMMDVVDGLTLPESKTEDDVLCIPLVGAYKDDGKTYIYGKVESGSIAVGEKIQVLPSKNEALVEGISIEATEFEKCYPGDNVHLRVRGIDENDIHGGYVATSIPTSLRPVEFLQARVVILEVKNIISAGSRFMLHIHAAQEEASFHKLLAKIDRKTNEVVEKDPACVKAGDVVIARIELDRPIVLEPHKDFDKLGRFMLRDEGRTIAIGVVTRLYESTRESLAKAGQ